MILKFYAISLMVLAAAIVGGCASDRTETTTAAPLSMKDVPAETWQKLSHKKIFFGHKSVGANIVDGVRDVTGQRQDIALNIVETREPAAFDKPIFAHAAIGKNSNPKSKVDDFVGLMNSGMGDRVDIAFMKFCWLDFLPGTDTSAVFEGYKTAMAELKKRYPKVIFVHVTSPLTSDLQGLRGWFKKTKDVIKRMMGRPNVYDNTGRNAFNELLRGEYTGKEPFFDLADIQATQPDGRRTFTLKDGKKQYSLVPDYTVDGGHLDVQGRKVVATQLLVFLARQIEMRQ